MTLFKKDNTNYFFKQFSIVSNYSLKAFEELELGLINFNYKNSLTLKTNVHEIEHEADLIKRETEEKLAKEFITPIDREDIFTLLNNIDDLTDAIDEVSYKIYIRAYTDLPENTKEFIGKAKEGINAVIELIKQLNNFNKKEILDPYIEKVKQIEEETDYIYEKNVHALYSNHKEYDYRQLVLYEKIYSMFEQITDKCRDISRTIETIMYKNI